MYSFATMIVKDERGRNMKTKIIIEVSGGTVQGVYKEDDNVEIEVDIIDYDTCEAEGTTPSEIPHSYITIA